MCSVLRVVFALTVSRDIDEKAKWDDETKFEYLRA